MSLPCDAYRAGSNAFKSRIKSTPAKFPVRVTTRLRRPGRGLPMDSKVLRPIKMGWPIVTSLNHLCSPRRRQGILLFCPITRFRVIATIAFILVHRLANNGDVAEGQLAFFQGG